MDENIELLNSMYELHYMKSSASDASLFFLEKKTLFLGQQSFFLPLFSSDCIIEWVICALAAECTMRRSH